MQVDRTKVKRAMIESCLNTKQLSREAGVSQATVNQVLNHERRIRPDTLGKLSKALGVPWQSLLVEEETLDF